MVDEYVAAANEALQSDNLQKIDSVAREFAMVFCGEIPNLSHYGVAKIARNGSAPYATVDLKKNSSENTGLPRGQRCRAIQRIWISDFDEPQKAAAKR